MVKGSSYDVSIIFVYHNTPKEITNAVRSIKKAVGKYSYQIIVVDNDSPKKIPRQLLNISGLKYLQRENIGYGRALNEGAKIAEGGYLLLANPDLIFEKDSISSMIGKMESDPSIGMIGPQLLDKNKKILKVGSDIPLLPGTIFSFSVLNKLFPNNLYSKKYFLLDFDRKKEREIPAIAGACMLVRKDVFNKVKGFDKRFFMYFEEADMCYRISKAGYRVLYYPLAKVIHLVGKSSNDKKWIEKTFERSRYEFLKKYHGRLLGTLGEGAIRLLNLPVKLN